MKNRCDRTFFTTFIAFSLVFPVHIAQSAIPGSVDWLTYISTQTGFSYKKNCALITTAQKVHYILDMFYYRFWYKKTELYHALCTITQELEYFEKELLILEEKALLEIKAQYNISDEIWSECLHDIKKIKQSYQADMLKPYPNTFHDSAIGEDITNFLTLFLTESNINPASINIILADQKSADSDPNRLAQTVVQLSIKKGDNWSIENEYTPSTITIFPHLITQNNEIKMSICAHEVQHLDLHHSITIIVLIEYLAHYYGVTAEDFRQSSHHYTLTQIHEAQAEIIAAIKNPTASQCLTSLRSQHYYPEYLYEKHFCQLATIDTLWKLHNKLENIYFTKGNLK